MISIIGAGPAGGYAAYLLAKAGKDVSLFEEHAAIGIPVQCTGILTSAIFDVMEVPKNTVVNRIKNFRFMGQKNTAEISMRHENIIVDRAKFDESICNNAVDAGAKLYVKTRYEGFNGKEIFTNQGNFKTDILLGADGPFSRVAHTNGLLTKREYVYGMQATVAGNFEKDTVDIYPGLSEFGWVVPENESLARVGVVARKAPKDEFNALVKKYGKPVCYSHGPIPLYSPSHPTQKGNVYLVGDAAAHVKATTYGGIIYGVMGAQEFAKSICENKDYTRLWKERFGKELWISLKMRQALNKLTLEDYDRLTHLISKKAVMDIFGSVERDFPLRMVLKLLIKEPRFFAYALKAF